MRHPLPTRAPFSFSQSLRFIRRFPPNREEFVIGDDSITAAIAIGDRAVPFTVRELCPPAGQKAASKGTVPFAVRELCPPAGQKAGSKGTVPFAVRELCPPAGQKAASKGMVPFASLSKGTVPFASLEVEAPDDVPAHEIVPRVSAWLGADHDLASFYAAAKKDPPFDALVRELYGLHHVAFMSLAEIAVYCVMMQRAPITMAARMKARFLDRFGLRVKLRGRRLREDSVQPADNAASLKPARRGPSPSSGDFVQRADNAASLKPARRGPSPSSRDSVQRADNAAGERELRAMPELAMLATLDGDEIGEAIRHRVKGPKVATVVRGVAAIGEPFLRTAPYAEARDALLEIPGVGPFSAGAILLRGLGRMDEVPLEIAAEEAKAIYGRAYDPAAIAKRYGAHIGYWSFYVKTGVARQSQ